VPPDPGVVETSKWLPDPGVVETFKWTPDLGEVGTFVWATDPGCCLGRKQPACSLAFS